MRLKLCFNSHLPRLRVHPWRDDDGVGGGQDRPEDGAHEGGVAPALEETAIAADAHDEDEGGSFTASELLLACRLCWNIGFQT